MMESMVFDSPPLTRDERSKGTKSMDDQKKYHIDPKGPKQRNRPKQLLNHNPPIYDVENINSTNKVRSLLLANKPQTVP